MTRPYGLPHRGSLLCAALLCVLALLADGGASAPARAQVHVDPDLNLGQVCDLNHNCTMNLLNGIVANVIEAGAFTPSFDQNNNPIFIGSGTVNQVGTNQFNSVHLSPQCCGAGTYNLLGAAQLTVDGIVMGPGGGAATFNQSGTSQANVAQTIFLNSNPANGAGSATYNLLSGTLTAGGIEAGSGDTATTGAFNQSGGSASLGYLFVGKSDGATGSSTHTGGTLAVTGSLAVGYSAGSTGTLTVNNGVSVTTPSALIGSGAGGTGTATISGAGSMLTTDHLSVGWFGNGTLSLENGAKALQGANNAATSIGSHAGSVGTLTVTGTGSALEANNELSIGFLGTGTLNVLAGATATHLGLSGTDTSIGRNGGSVGTVNVDGAGSLLTTTNGLTVGAQGTGTLALTNGGKATQSGDVHIASAPGSVGTVSVTGAGSMLTVGNALTLGDAGSGTLSIGAGGVVQQNGSNGGGTSIGHQGGAIGTVTVDGAGSLLSTTNSFSLGGNGGTGSTTISNGGMVTTGGPFVIGAGNGGSGALTINTGGTFNSSGGSVGQSTGATGAVTTSGAGSTFSATGFLALGGGNAGDNGQGMLSVLNGATASIASMNVGQGDSGSGAVTVDGAGSQLSMGGPLSVATGLFGNPPGVTSTGSLTVSNGGKVLGGSAEVGQWTGATGTASVTGAGSQLSLSGQINVGGGGTGTLNVSNGGVASIGSANLGSQTGGAGTVTVSGAGSALNSVGDVSVGGNPSSNGQGAVDILSGATALVGSMSIGLGQSGVGTVTVDGAGSQLTMPGFLSIGAGMPGPPTTASGTMNVTQGGKVFGSTAHIGQNAGVTGTLAVDGAGSQFSLSNTLQVGPVGAGTVNVTGGGKVDAASLGIGGLPGSAGTVKVDGASSQLTLVGGLTIGNSNSNATLDVRNGGSVTQTASNAFANIGNGAGTAGTATLSGAGASWSLGGGLTVGNFGAGTLNVNAGTSVTQSGIAGGSLIIGNRAGSLGTLNIAGGHVTALRTDVGGASEAHAFVGVGQRTTNAADASLHITDGGVLTIGDAGTGTAPGSTFGAGLNIGGSGGATPPSGAGQVTVAGPGSKIETLGVGGFVNVGRFSTATQTAANLSTLDISGGGMVNTTNMGVGRGGANGQLTLDGVGSQINLFGVGVTGVGAGMTVGRDTSLGAVTVRNSAAFTINGTGATAGSPGPGITLGFDAGSSGTLNLESGSTTTITSDRPATGLTIGRLGVGTLNVTGGATLTINDNSGTGSGGLAFGGNGSSATGGSFTGLVSGVGSAITVNSVDGAITIGTRSAASGTLTIAAGAAVATDVLTVGHVAGSSGTLVVTGAGTTLNLVGDAAGAVGAGMTVGRGGTGVATISGGAVVSINGTGTSNPAGISVGGSPTAAGGNGTLTVTGAGTQINVAANASSNGGLQVGRDITGSTPSTGTMTISDGAVVTMAAGSNSSIGTSVGSAGTVTVTGAGSRLIAGSFLGIGRTQSSATGGTGQLNVTLGGTVQASTIHNGFTGTISGSGTLIADSFINDGTINPGNSPGTLRLSVADFQNNGTIVLEVQDLGGGNFVTDVLVFDNGFVPDLNQIEFAFLSGTDPTTAANQGVLRIDNFLMIETAPGVVESITQALAGDPGLLNQFQQELAETTFTGSAGGDTQIVTLIGYNPNDGTVRDIVITPAPTDVPEPVTLALFTSGLAGLAWVRRQRQMAAQMR